MKKLILNSIIMMLAAVLCLSSCNGDDPIPVIPTTVVNLEVPANLKNVVLTSAKATLTNVETKQVTTIEASQFIKDENGYKIMCNDIKAGNYNLDLCGYPHEDEEILPPDELIAKYRKERKAMDERVDAAIAEIEKLLKGE